MKDEQRLELAGAILDGTPIAWDEAAGAAPQAIATFKLVAEIAEAHRAPSRERSNDWGPLQLRGLIGHGTYGDVYRAYDPALDREVAVKLIRRPSASGAGEAKRLARVRHPNVVTVHGAGEFDGVPGIWMELVQGETLASVCEAQGPLAADAVVEIGSAVCRALSAVHDAGLLHGDIKPQNVMREPNGRVVLMDFGTGRLVSSSSAALAGTPLYLAPEILTGSAPDARGDIYAVGGLLYYLLTKTAPVEGGTLEEVRASHATGIRTPVRKRRTSVPRGLAAVVDRALSSDPAKRFQTAAELDRALLSEVAVASPTGTSPWPWLAVAVAVIAGAAMLTAQWQRRDPTRLPEGVSVAVLPSSNLTGDLRLDRIATYRIITAQGLCAQLRSSDGRRNNVVQANCSDRPDFHFTLEPVRDGYSRIRTAYGQCLQVMGGQPLSRFKGDADSDQRQPLSQWDCGDGDEFLFRFPEIRNGGGSRHIQTRYNSCYHVRTGTPALGADFWSWLTCGTSSEFQFRLEERPSAVYPYRMTLRLDDLHSLKTTEPGEDEIYFIVVGRDNAGKVFQHRLPANGHFSVNDERPNDHLRNVELWASSIVSPGYVANLVVLAMEEDAGTVDWRRVATAVARSLTVGAGPVAIAAPLLEPITTLPSESDDYIGSMSVQLGWQHTVTAGYGSADSTRGSYDGYQNETGRPSWHLSGNGTDYRAYLLVDVK